MKEMSTPENSPPESVPPLPPPETPAVQGADHWEIKTFLGPLAGTWQPCSEDVYQRTHATGVYSGVPGAQVAEARAMFAGQPPPLWCLHLLGPDDVHAAPSYEHAEKAVKRILEWEAERAAAPGTPSVNPVVAAWPYSASAHAEFVGDFIETFLVPKWQIEALDRVEQLVRDAIDGDTTDPTKLNIRLGDGVALASFKVDHGQHPNAEDFQLRVLTEVGSIQDNPDGIGSYTDYTRDVPENTTLYAFLPPADAPGAG